MNKKGFTLVELLAVIIILSALALLASTSVTKIVRDSKNDLYETQILSIKSAAEAWGADNLNRLPEENSCKYITLRDLKSYGLVDVNIKNPKTNDLFSDDLIIKIISKLNSYGNTNITYEVEPKNINDCENAYSICKLIEDVSPTGISVGDKYQCKVKSKMETGFEDGYYFYVLSTNEDGTANLIMDRNINSNGTVTKKIIRESEKALNGGIYNLVAYNKSNVTGVGPETAMNFLNNATSTWNNILNLNITYDDEGKNFTNFKVTGKARLPYYNEVIEVGCKADPLSELSCPVWMIDYMDDVGPYYETSYQKNPIDEIFGYWTFSSLSETGAGAWIVFADGYVEFDGVDINLYGIRPVITIKLY